MAFGLVFVVLGSAALLAKLLLPVVNTKVTQDVLSAQEAMVTLQGGGTSFWKAWGSNATLAARGLALALTWDEKLTLVTGVAQSWGGSGIMDGFYAGNVNGIPRLGVPSQNMQDAGQGFRTSDARMVGTVTSWPSALSVTAAWDIDLTRRYAQHIAREFRGKGANAVLGPGMDVVRVPQGGRATESLVGEEPFLGAKHVAAYIGGMQSGGVACVAKHFAMNTQETHRNSYNVIKSERARWEVYYAPVLSAVKAGVASIMCSFNAVGGAHSCANGQLLTEDLKARMGFEGFVMTDWWALKMPFTADGATSGLDQVQPGNTLFPGSEPWTQSMLKDLAGVNRVTDMARRILYGMISSGAFDNDACLPGLSSTCASKLLATVTSDQAAANALEVAIAGVVLLKNDGGILPLVGGSGARRGRVALLGSACDAKHITDPDTVAWNAGDYYVVGGSGRVLSPNYVSIRKAFQAYKDAGAIDYLDGVYSDSVSDAMSKLRSSNFDVAITCGGVTSGEDSDRSSLKLDQHDYILQLAAAIATSVPLVVLTMSSGSILTDFANRAAAVVSVFLAGQATGNAFASVLLGKTSPSGRLPVTFPVYQDDVTPLCTTLECDFNEGLHVGWRGLIDAPVAFPFGHGLSYTTFNYTWRAQPVFTESSDPMVPVVRMEVTVKNIGKQWAAREVVQLYMKFPRSAGEPPWVLRGFAKTASLAPGAQEVVAFELTSHDLSIYWDCQNNPYCDRVVCDGSGCFDCGSRLQWLASPTGGSMRLPDAKKALTAQFPDDCARCDIADPSSNLPDGVAFVGCFADKVADRDLTVKKESGSLQECAKRCAGFLYFGRQFTNECWCGNAVGKYGPSSACNCDDPTNVGGNCNCAYQFLNFAPPQNITAKLVGCFADRILDRDLPVRQASGSLASCAMQCSAFTYFGRQWTNECWCGYAYGKHGSATNCQCDAATNVGGNANCVYIVPDLVKPSPPEVDYIGCFADVAFDRDLVVAKGTAALEDCAKLCSGFLYFGRQWAGECWCGNRYGRYGPSTACQCNQVNVGGGVNCVYQVPPSINSGCTPGFRRVNGGFDIAVGASSRDLRLAGSFTVPTGNDVVVQYR